MKQQLKRWLWPLAAALPMLLAVPSQAVTISPQMIEQFKQLPPAEQQRLARQYGIDPAMLQGATQSGPAFQQPDAPVVTPRQVAVEEPQEEMKAEDEATQARLKPFGYDLFAGEPSTYAPVTDVPVPANYVLGPGDELRVQLFGKDAATHTLTVNRNGAIAFPELGPIQVAGLTFGEAKAMLAKQVQEQIIGVQANVTMGELRSIRIFVAGDAYRPGSYTVSALSTVTHALSMAGGLKEIGSLRDIQVKRNGELVGRFDVYDLLLRGDASGDVRLQSGDVVFVPSLKSTVAVEGDVRRPAIYELTGGESMSEVLAMAGGALPGAYPAASIVERYSKRHQRTIVNVDLTASVGQRMAAKNGDRLVVRSTTNELDGAVTLVGQVARPGHYQWQDGMRVSNVLRSLSADLTWNTDVTYALVVRETNLRGDIEVHGFSPEQAIRMPGSREDLLLMPRDRIVVFADRDEALDRRELGKVFQALAKDESLLAMSQVSEKELETGLSALALQEQQTNRSSIAGVAVSEEVRSDDQALQNARLKSRILLSLFQHDSLIGLSPELTRKELLFPILAQLNNQARFDQNVKVVAVAGEVSYPGIYPLVEGGHISNLVSLAGGLKESAYMMQAELSRTDINDLSGARIQHLPIQLSQVIGGSPDYDLALQSRDRLNVLAKPDWQDAPTVELRGEVRFPGVYTIQRGETLSDVIKRAGGYTEYAYPYGGVFTREAVRKQEQLEIQRVVTGLRKELANRTLSEQGSFASVADTNAMLAQLEQIEATGRMVVDFEKILSEDPRHNLIAERGDLIYIPPMRQTIAVMGEVQHATSHRFDERLSVKDYLKLSGGASQRADEDRLYVIRADGSVMIPRSSFWFGGKQTLQPGDTIIMPLDTNYKDNLTLWTQVTGIIYNTAVAISALNII
ncbi:SLBB domain-containing protein [Ferrimonas balearica]|uniref:SLBB domain-containing protein n=1 Tax=Ferrimonas balearica TaxID=44012 RepID=UPI001C9944C9|nr:SLBB domain-containing protein [Ferrimonas balearica]MBY5990765.1 SLBB domain-containing protein [Ferrimonas balearica]